MKSKLNVLSSSLYCSRRKRRAVELGKIWVHVGCVYRGSYFTLSALQVSHLSGRVRITMLASPPRVGLGDALPSPRLTPPASHIISLHSSRSCWTRAEFPSITNSLYLRNELVPFVVNSRFSLKRHMWHHSFLLLCSCPVPSSVLEHHFITSNYLNPGYFLKLQ